MEAVRDHAGVQRPLSSVLSAVPLRQAQKEPEKYRDLIVKVAGYSAYFTQLIKPLQDGIISRKEHKL